jgi:hypothetical protein
MKLLKALTQHPEAVAIGLICLVLGLGNAAPRLSDLARFENRDRARVGVYQRLDAPPPARLHIQKI